MRTILTIIVLVAFAPKLELQQHPARQWYCVRQPFAETTDGDVIALKCTAALPKSDKLDAEDEDTLAKLEVTRWNAGLVNEPVLRSKTKEMKDSLRMGFGQKVGQICQKHPNIVLAPFAPDLTSSVATLYGCKNIIAAPEN